jgi:putative ABC transport system permease protein
MVVYEQLDFMRSQHLGFEKDQKLIIPVRGATPLGRNFESVKSELAGIAGINGATASSHVPGQTLDRWDTRVVGASHSQYYPMNYLYVDSDFIPEYDIAMAAGRMFHRDMGTDTVRAFILNRAAVEKFGWSTPDEAIGYRIAGLEEGQIIGVTEDFHYRGLQAVLEPLIMEFRHAMFGLLSLTVNTQDLSNVISFAKSKWLA